jgi:tetratricopeptide (TPR) repeat protein
MKKEIFNTLIKDPNNISPKHKESLKKIIDTFPYATSIRLLYLSSLLNDADILFEQELKKTAAYISDRSVLKQLINKPSKTKNYIIDQPQKNLIPVERKTKDSNVRVVISDDKENLNKPENKIDAQFSDSNPKTPKKEKHSLKVNKTKKESVNELNKLIITSAIDASISLDIDKVSAEEQRKENSRKSFLEWIEPNKVEKNVSKLSIQQQERLKFRKKAEILIDEFIQNQPKIKPRTEFYSPENMARKSIEDSEEIVTETLAKIYSKQGNIAKAKSIYNQLILKNPEKKSYFTSLIRQLVQE